MKKIFFAIAFVAVTASVLMTSSCELDPCKSEICDESYAYISLELTDALGKPYILDSYTVSVNEGGEVVLSKTINPATDTTGLYVVLSDTEKDKVTKDGVYFNFIGKKGGVDVVNQPYRIAKDCCHVVIKSGKQVLEVK